MILTNKNDNIITLTKKKIMLLEIIKQYSARSADTLLVIHIFVVRYIIHLDWTFTRFMQEQQSKIYTLEIL